MAIDFHQHSRHLRELLDAGVPFVIVTMAHARGSTPQTVGAKALITSTGLAHGTIGGGKVEVRAVAHARALLGSSTARTCELVTWNLQTEIGMTCGGEVCLVFEVVNRHDWKVAVFGAGHVAQSLVPLLLQLQCGVTCLDSRRDWLERLPEHPRLRTICTEHLKEQVEQLDPTSFFVLMTQGHATDVPVLAELLTRVDAPYIGVIGSLQKAKILRRELQQMQIPEDRLRSFHCPIGLPLGNNTPPEISISVVAQLIQERDRLGVVQQKTKSFKPQ